jgi:hypothetical protein
VENFFMKIVTKITKTEFAKVGHLANIRYGELANMANLSKMANKSPWRMANVRHSPQA